jgi:hypothetical protein
MPEGYCRCLERQRSPFACREVITDILVMEMKRNAAGDSLRWSWYGTHEGGTEAMLGFDTATKAFRSRPSDDPHRDWGELLIEAEQDPDRLSIRRGGDSTPMHFVRIRSENEAINSRTLAGRYLSASDSSVVVLDAEGSIAGLVMNRYEVLTDFAFGMEDGDIVFLHGPGSPEVGIAHRFKWTGKRLRFESLLQEAEPGTTDTAARLHALTLECIE